MYLAASSNDVLSSAALGKQRVITAMRPGMQTPPLFMYSRRIKNNRKRPQKERTQNNRGRRKNDVIAGVPPTEYVQSCAEKRNCFAKQQPDVAGCGWLQPGRNFLST